jgi:hypothetical protein
MHTYFPPSGIRPKAKRKERAPIRPHAPRVQDEDAYNNYDGLDGDDLNDGEIGDHFDGEVGFDGDADDDAELQRVLAQSADDEFERALAVSLLESQSAAKRQKTEKENGNPPPSQ